MPVVGDEIFWRIGGLGGVRVFPYVLVLFHSPADDEHTLLGGTLLSGTLLGGCRESFVVVALVADACAEVGVVPCDSAIDSAGISLWGVISGWSASAASAAAASSASSSLLGITAAASVV